MKFNAYLRHIGGAIAIAPLISLNYSTYCQTAIAPYIWLNYHKKAAAAFLAAAAFKTISKSILHHYYKAPFRSEQDAERAEGLRELNKEYVCKAGSRLQ